MKMNYFMLLILCMLFVLLGSGVDLLAIRKPVVKVAESDESQNLSRAIAIAEEGFKSYFSEDLQVMYRYYNPFTKERPNETASVWMYTSSIEAVNAILAGLKHQKSKGNITLYDKYYALYLERLATLIDHLGYFEGSFTLTSFTQTRNWSVYAVDRANSLGNANVAGIMNVYDDQMWLIQELLKAYKLTKNESYLEKAEYLTAYVLDGWDVSRDENGNEHGGIPWGPGYVTKHACSNGPMIAPLVELYKIYKERADQISYRYIDQMDKKTRLVEIRPKSEHYLSFAKKIYHWQQSQLLQDEGVYFDMLGGCEPYCQVAYEEIAGVRYRKHNVLRKAEGRAYSYNSGTMLTGAAALYKATFEERYMQDASLLAQASFKKFALLDFQLSSYYTFAYDGFNNWFNTVLLHGFLAVNPLFPTGGYVHPFQQNLDYAFQEHVHNGFLPPNLLGGWSSNPKENRVEGMFVFTFATQYALLAIDKI